MTPSILDFLSRHAPAELGSVLEVGSFDVNGSPRSVLAGRASAYVGVDIEPGPGVDVVLSGESLFPHFPAGHFDAVVCCECLEHTVRPWLVVDQLKAVLRPGGLLFVSTPTFGFPLHRYPIDCYRFGEDAYRGWLFEGYEALALESLACPDGFPILAGVGRR